MSHKVAKHIIVSGRVQRGGCRYFVNQKAKECQLTGWVKNLPKGKVEIEAEGDETDLSCFVEYLKAGNGYSRTDQLHQSKIEPSNYTNFSIRY
ncbi:acylphosphatase [uncultured Sunxiuqinia sp.]|uniref:acylphosphatase n=1 Tax=uncultured Sunxiuqinia sp. TaxID=1573825 RepID=UPI002AA942E2|nr:acylphosphatase [uncultured Sunxiuqinia sp.]